MRNACRTTLATAIILLASINLHSQNYPNGLSMDSVSPSVDSVFIKEVRAKMDRIRVNQQRPTVGLVLSGGGAKGAAEVGALMFIEELGIPIDMVCGTSIGGLIGGLYAVGYDSHDLQELFLTQDWDMMLSDAVPREYIPYTQKIHKSKFLFNVPFRDANEVFEDRDEGFMNSLPSGVAFGFNVNNKLSSLTVGYQDSISFSKLPKPFVCVAADMVSSKAKNWGSGSLKTAMRSTMSIPGLFDPVRTEGMVLVDGGVRNNFPADIAKQMGADYIIGIEISDLKPKYEDIRNIGSILSQFITMLGTDAYNKNVHIPDIFIKPQISEYNMLSFNKEAVETMIARGYSAAKEKEQELLELKKKLGSDKRPVNTRKATNLETTGVRIASISFEGLSYEDSEMMIKMLDFQAGDVVDEEIMRHAMNKMQATGAFSQITYSLLGEHSPYNLVFHCETSPTHSLSLGVRLDSEEWASVLVNLGINNNKLTGSKFNLNAKIGQNLKLDAHYSVLDFPWMPTVNFDVSLARYKGLLGSTQNSIQYDASYWTHKEELYLTDIRWTKYNFKLGFKNQYNDVNKNSYLGSIIVNNLSREALHGDYLGVFASSNFYTLDRHYYPNTGTNLQFKANYDFAKLGDSEFDPVICLSLDSESVIPISERWHILPKVHLRNVINIGSKSDISILHANFIGGAIADRYIENQVPFFGIDNVIMVDEYLASASLECRYNPFKNLYFSAMTGFVESSDAFVDLARNFNPDIFAWGLEAGYNSAGGPVKLNIHWSAARQWGMYLSFGFDF